MLCYVMYPLCVRYLVNRAEDSGNDKIRYDTIRCFNVLSKPNGSVRARYLTAADARTAWSNRLSVTSRPRLSLGTTPTDRQTDGRTDS